MRKKRKTKAKTVFGVAWYSRDQWRLLQQIASDKNTLHDTYDEWLIDFNSHLQMSEQAGMQCTRIPIDVVELIKWCSEKKMPINGEARSHFTAEKTRDLYEGDSLMKSKT